MLKGVCSTLTNKQPQEIQIFEDYQGEIFKARNKVQGQPAFAKISEAYSPSP
jgi:hypothetical protein